jgi:hypothetical protein
MSNANYDNHETAGKISKPFFKNWFVWVGIIGIIPIIIFTVFWGYQFFFQIPVEKQAELELEFKMLAPLPNASLVTYSAWHKTTHVLVTAKYLTHTNPADIFKYYDEQLRQLGWQFQGAEGVTDWDRDLGGKAADYCKGDYGAELQYAGEKANYGWTYAFDVSWGFRDCKAGN